MGTAHVSCHREPVRLYSLIPYGAALSLKVSGSSARSPALQHPVGHVTPALQKKPSGKDAMAGHVRANARLAAADLMSRSKILHDSKTSECSCILPIENRRLGVSKLTVS